MIQAAGRYDHAVPSKYLLSLFERQFKRDGDGFVYRMSMKGPPIRVTRAERDGFVAGFLRGYFLLMVAGGAGMAAAVLLLAWPHALEANPTMLLLAFAAIVGATIALLAWGSFRTWRAPARALAHRGPKPS